MNDFDDLQPEEADMRYQHLIQDLQHIYAPGKDTARSLDYARQQFFQHTNDRLSRPQVTLLKREDRGTPLDRAKQLDRHTGRTAYPRLSTIAAIILVGLLVGSFATLLTHSHIARTGSIILPVQAHKPTGIHELHMMNATTGWAVGDGVTLLYTNDGGLNWQDISPQHEEKTTYWSRAAAFLGTSMVWLAPTVNTTSPQFQPATTSYVFHTSDNGKTWKKTPVMTHGNTIELITFSDAQNGWLLTRFEVGVHEVTSTEQIAPPDLFRTRDGGKTWIKVLNSAEMQAQLFRNVSITGMTFIDSHTGWISGATDYKGARIFITQNGGITWQQQQLVKLAQILSQVNLIEDYIDVPHFFTASDGIISIEYLYGPPSSGQVLGVAVYATHDGGKSWISSKGGSWAMGQNPSHTADLLPQLGTVVFTDMMHGWVKLNDWVRTVLSSTSDGGQHWTNVTPFHDPAPYSSLPPEFVTPNIGWIFTFDRKGNTQVTALYKTTDGGHTWTQVHARFPDYILPKSAY